MKKICLAVVIVFALCVSTQAAIKTQLNCDPPTTYVNGVPVYSFDVISYKYYCGKASGAYTVNAPSATTVIDLTTGKLIPLTAADGKYYCTATALSSFFGTESDYATPEVTLYKTGGTFLSAPEKCQPPANVRAE